jgi:hypothetical protein
MISPNDLKSYRSIVFPNAYPDETSFIDLRRKVIKPIQLKDFTAPEVALESISLLLRSIILPV